MTKEWAARVFLVLLMAGIGAALVLGWKWQDRGILIRARMPENGGWSPADLTAHTGEPLHLRLTSDDVTHGFAVGRMDFQPVDILPGEISEVTLRFDQPGKYVFYCTRWCGPDHWRMRGTIEVAGNSSLSSETEDVQPPLYLALSLDIDAPHPAAVTPAAKPSAAQGNRFLDKLPVKYLSEIYYQTHSPAEIWQDLRLEPVVNDLDDDQIWSLVAAIWAYNTSPTELEMGRRLYAENCAACHGENGDGNGVMADSIKADPGQMAGHTNASPIDFTQSNTMLGASPALLQGKIVRGGMGTGMPYWGPIFTEEQTWAVVSYLWTFQFDQ